MTSPAPSDDEKLVERLRKRHEAALRIAAQSDDLHIHLFSDGDPDSRDAASRLQSLSAEVARLREGLESIAKYCPHYATADLARAALKKDTP
jgi:hypothetical protein